MFLYDSEPCEQLPVLSCVCVFLVTLVGCASWLMKGEPPEVLVTNITPLEGTAFEQRLQVDLRIRNPNDFDLLATALT